MPEASRTLLASLVGERSNASLSFLDALSGGERKRFLAALKQSVALQLAFNMTLQLAGSDGQPIYLDVRGAPVEFEHGAIRLAGTFRDITNERQRDTDHEKVVTQLQALLDALPQGVSVIDKELRLILWNRRFHEILDFPQTLVFRHARFEDFIRINATRGDYGPGDPEAQVQTIVARAREFLPHRFERQLTGGRTLLVEGFPFRSGGEVSGFVTTYTDITLQKSTEEQLKRQRDVMTTIVENFPGGISLCDADLRFTTYNEQFKTLLDFPSSLFDKGWVHFEELARFNADRGEYGAGNRDDQVKAVVARARTFEAHQIERERPNGRWLEIRGTPILSGGFVTSYIDITERKQMEDQVRQLAFNDPLTRLPNRRLLHDRLLQAMSSSIRTALHGALMVLDLDNFKSLNDTQGHFTGDKLLIEVARRLKACLRESDTVARFGGDEFVVMLGELDTGIAQSTEQATAVAEKIRASLAAPYLLNVSKECESDRIIEHRCSASIGVVLFMGNKFSQDEVVKWADAAMYEAKAAGRNRFRFHALES